LLNLTPCNFRLLGFLKESMKGMELKTEDPIVEIMTTISRGVAFETMEPVFQEWIRRLIWVINNNGKYSFE
jgi:hypothetical protein